MADWTGWHLSWLGVCVVQCRASLVDSLAVAALKMEKPKLFQSMRAFKSMKDLAAATPARYSTCGAVESDVGLKGVPS